MSSAARIVSARVLADLRDLSRFGRNEGGGIDRASFSAADVAARDWLRGRCAEAGLEVAVDGIGNMIISSPLLDADVAEHRAVWAGSHIDAVPDGGAFDGALGVIAALEALRALQDARVRLKRPVRVIAFSDEEGSFAHLLGSSAVTRGFAADELDRMVGRDGARLADGLRALGLTPQDAAAACVTADDVSAYIELHIEQGPNLERRGIPIGVVTSIVAIGGGTVTFTGRADHAGTTPLGSRRDAGLAAAAFALALPDLARQVSSGAVATTGMIRFEPGGANIVPGRAEVSVDFRDVAWDRVVDLESRIIAAAQAVGVHRDVTVDIDFETPVPGAQMDEHVRAAIARAAAQLGLTATDIPSGAGHDAQNMATIVPTGMIFVPSVDGRSHSPAEYTRDEDVVHGAEVLLATIHDLATA